jgi:hypothetical protein
MFLVKAGGIVPGSEVASLMSRRTERESWESSRREGGRSEDFLDRRRVENSLLDGYLLTDDDG